MMPLPTATAPLSAERVERIQIPPGAAGTDATIDAMARAAMGEFGAGSGRIRELAITILRDAGVAERDQQGEVVAIHQWVQDHLRYVKDPLWYEFVTYPETLAFERADGDCDDHVVLEAALLGAIGIPSRFVVFAFRGGPWSHVAMQANVKGRWIPLDPIVKTKPAGWVAPDADRTKVYGVNTPDGPARRVVSVIGFVGLALALYGVFTAYRRTIISFGG
jgi:transglutaminase-like putative cysteine protease